MIDLLQDIIVGTVGFDEQGVIDETLSERLDVQDLSRNGKVVDDRLHGGYRFLIRVLKNCMMSLFQERG